MSITLRINAQVHERYGERWKAKGGQYFETTIDSNVLFYSDEEDLVDSLKSLLSTQSNDHINYTYVDHEPIFHDVVFLPDITEYVANRRLNPEITE